jgi:hypothetical protein
MAVMRMVVLLQINGVPKFSLCNAGSPPGHALQEISRYSRCARNQATDGSGLASMKT